MAPGGGKPGKGKGQKGGVWREDSQSERERSADESQPQTATQAEFLRTRATDDHAQQETSQSASTWGSNTFGIPSTDPNPVGPSVFGGQWPSASPKYGQDINITSPLPQQITQPVFMTPSDPVTIGPKDATQQSRETTHSALPTMTKGSTSRMISSGSGDKEEVTWIEQVPVKDLTPVRGPLQEVALRQDFYSAAYIEFFATQALHTMAVDVKHAVALSDRWAQALKLGGAYMSKAYRKQVSRESKQLSPQDRTLLKDILEPLDELLKKIDKYSDGRYTGFKLNKKRLVAFTKRLIQLRNEAEEDFVLQAEGLPLVPHWGLEGNANLFWEANDFEILGACYREDVTQFCVKILEVCEARKDDEVPVPSGILRRTNKTTSDTTKLQTDSTTARPAKPKMFDDAPLSHSARVQMFTNRTASIFGNPSRNTASHKLQTLLGAQPMFIASAPDPNDPGGNGDNEGGNDNPRQNPRGPPGGPPSGLPSSGASKGRQNKPPQGPPNDPSGDPSGNNGNERSGHKPVIPQFDSKLKVDIIPTWDGNPDDLGRWLIKINRLSERSSVVYQQLGYLVPTRLTGAAELWYYSQNSTVRSQIEENWGTLKNAIAGYYMNRSYLERQCVRANKAKYRQMGYTTETPSEYFIRKLELLEIVYNYSEGELINEIMAGAPSFWSTILAPHLYDSIEGFQMAVKFQEDNLLRVGQENSRYRQDNAPWNRESRNPFTKYQNNTTPNARVNAVGWSKLTSNPPFPKDDTNVSPRATPEEKGGRPCRHCGSLKHWDPECKYSRKGERKARVNAVAASPDDERAQAEYDDLYFGLESEDEETDDQDFQ